jgi:hypothetical protein
MEDRISDPNYELRVIDTRTGETVKVLEKGEDGANTQTPKDVYKMTPKQHEELKILLEKIGNQKNLTRTEIVKIIEEIRKPQKQKYRQSGHLVDEKLKHSFPVNAHYQPTLFDLISPNTRQKIEESKIEVKAEGIKLTPPENKLIHALNLILHEKSQNKNPTSEDFYSGNAMPELIPYGGKEQKAAVLKFRPAELYKAYIGHHTYSGHDIAFINNILYQVESKKVLIKYDRVKKVSTGKGKESQILTDRIEDFQSLIKILSFIPDLTNEEKAKMNKGDTTIVESKGEMIIALNPIFTDQIDTKYIEFPADTNRRLVIAAGGHKKVTSSMMTLMEWMLREMSSKRYRVEINEGKLPYILGLEKYVKQNRKKLLQDRIVKDIEAITNMGIIIQTEKTANAIGGVKWTFHLNKDYE